MALVGDLEPAAASRAMYPAPFFFFEGISFFPVLFLGRFRPWDHDPPFMVKVFDLNFI